MEKELFTDLLNNPLAGGSTVGAALLGLLYFFYKAYLSLKSDSSTSDAITTSLNSQGQVITMLREEVARLSTQVKQLQDNASSHDNEKLQLSSKLSAAEQSLQECLKAHGAPPQGEGNGSNQE